MPWKCPVPLQTHTLPGSCRPSPVDGCLALLLVASSWVLGLQPKHHHPFGLMGSLTDCLLCNIPVPPKDEEAVKKLTVNPGTKSKLPKPVQNLIKMIFDVESMKKAMVEYEVRHRVSCL